MKKLTKEEARLKVLQHLKRLVKYWDTCPNAGTQAERIDGVIFSLLVTLDGGSGDFPAMDIVLRPHKEDNSEFKNGMAINDDCQLHELWSRI